MDSYISMKVSEDEPKFSYDWEINKYTEWLNFWVGNTHICLKGEYIQREREKFQAFANCILDIIQDGDFKQDKVAMEHFGRKDI